MYQLDGRHVAIGAFGVAHVLACMCFGQGRGTRASERFQQLQARGARVQRVLWASTSTKNPVYRDVRYVEELIGPDTVVTAPLKTIRAFKDHGQVRRTLDTDVEDARTALAVLQSFGIDYDAVTQQLEDQGVAAFAKSYDELLVSVERKRTQLARGAERAVGMEP